MTIAINLLDEISLEWPWIIISSADPKVLRSSDG
jgi:hypothetical protein